MNERILDRVRKLLAHAEHPNTPPAEAEAMSAKAAEMMARHAIDLALVQATGEPGQVQPVVRTIALDAPYTSAKATLLSGVGKSYRVRVIIRGNGQRCTLIGFPSDIDVVEMLFTSLLLQATSAMLDSPEDVAARMMRRQRAFRHAFLLGYAARVCERIAQSVHAVEEQEIAASTALVLVDRRAAVDAKVAEEFPTLRKMRPSASSASGVRAGRAAADRAKLSHGALGGRRRAVGS